MKILKPGKVEMRKFVCPDCGCIFAESKKELCELSYGFRVSCPQNGCGYEFTDDGEPYEEHTQDDSREKLIWLIQNFRATNLETADCEADFLIANGVTFREG